MALCSRVMLSSGATDFTPRPGSPTRVARVPSMVSSAVGSARVPSLSFSRWIVMPLRAPSGSRCSR